MYTLQFDPLALEILGKLEPITKDRIWKKILKTKEDPHHFFVRLTERKDYKLRIGDYRVIADIDDSQKTIIITLIGHRKNIYK